MHIELSCKQGLLT